MKGVLIMPKTIFRDRWHHLKDGIKHKWEDISDEEIEEINGEFDKLVAYIKDKYGVEEEDAVKQVLEFQDAWINRTHL